MFTPLFASEPPTLHLAYSGMLTIFCYLMLTGRWREVLVRNRRQLASTAPGELVAEQTRAAEHDKVSDPPAPCEESSLLADLLALTAMVRSALVSSATRRDATHVNAAGHSADGHSADGHSADGHSADDQGSCEDSVATK